MLMSRHHCRPMTKRDTTERRPGWLSLGRISRLNMGLLSRGTGSSRSRSRHRRSLSMEHHGPRAKRDSIERRPGLDIVSIPLLRGIGSSREHHRSMAQGNLRALMLEPRLDLVSSHDVELLFRLRGVCSTGDDHRPVAHGNPTWATGEIATLRGLQGRRRWLVHRVFANMVAVFTGMLLRLVVFKLLLLLFVSLFGFFFFFQMLA